MSLNALISGQAGVALLVNGDQLSSLHAGQPAEPIRRSPGEARFLLGDAKDLQFVENVELAEIARELERATSRIAALHLSLILLDGTLEEDTRSEAALELDNLLAEDDVAEFVERILFSKPLPEEADVAGALDATIESLASKRLVGGLSSLQPRICGVYSAWQEIPVGLFESDREREQACGVAAREGLFRDLVLAEDGDALEAFLAKALDKAPLRAVRNHREIVFAWVAASRKGEFQAERTSTKGVRPQPDLADDILVFNGIDADTGRWLFPPIPTREVLSGLGRWRGRKWRKVPVPAGIDPRSLSECGWGIIAHRHEDPRVIAALSPLLRHRQEQAGRLFVSLSDSRKGFAGQSASEFLESLGVSDDPVDPTRLPFYLLLVGSPTRIPYQFEHDLCSRYAVGRVCFESPEEYRHYAESVVAAEVEGTARSQEAAFWAVRTPGDWATYLSADRLIAPVADRLGEYAREGWRVCKRTGPAATKEGLLTLLSGAESPALLFTASHGVGFPLGDGRQRRHQGALICQDWPGPGVRVCADHCFSADDVADDLNLHGLIAFFFSSHGAGVPEVDQFARFESGLPKRLALEPFMAGLPQRLLSHPKGGALAVIGQVERAWAFSFLRNDGREQVEAFARLADVLLRGYPVGFAMDCFKLVYSSASASLTRAIQRVQYAEEREVAEFWATQNDAPSYYLVGDPAVRARAAVS